MINIFMYAVLLVPSTMIAVHCFRTSIRLWSRECALNRAVQHEMRTLDIELEKLLSR